ncbi:hypothetical protein FGO68_gene13203 [Halteria grandinella]|uniref:Transmembrane protein n=1 Tax=Halteria grandinella TaxID=5974 RepID=A0A8J8SXJ5_HALGN|nr:hypothetical protein FGO68_gene13203 [Halteria grandinella]
MQQRVKKQMDHVYNQAIFKIVTSSTSQKLLLNVIILIIVRMMNIKLVKFVTQLMFRSWKEDQIKNYHVSRSIKYKKQQFQIKVIERSLNKIG